MKHQAQIGLIFLTRDLQEQAWVEEWGLNLILFSG